ncbi:hypothetical protein MP228_011057 [Amoeboaphelidium protococcarum]|nr:hypothetical protein MP228_011057 [Amoeboaphelidium protococcarum]
MSKTPEDQQYQGTLPPGWTAVWDDNEGDYYFWNKETNETTWDNPRAVEKDAELYKIDHHEPSESLQNAGKSQIPQYQDYVVTASFSAHSNKFKSDLSAASLPAQQINSEVTVSDIQQSLQHQQSGKRRQNQGAMKQMNAFFNYDEWISQRNSEAYKQTSDGLNSVPAISNSQQQQQSASVKQTKDGKVKKPSKRKPLEVHDGRVLFIDASGKNNGLCDLAILQKAVQSGEYGPAVSLIKVSNNHNMDGKIVSVYRVQSQDQEFADASPRPASATITVANKVRKWKEVKISESIGANDLNVKIKQIKLQLQSDHPVKVVLNADKKRKSQFSLSKPNFGPDILKQIKQTLSSDGSLKGIKFTEPSRVNEFQWLAQIQPSVKIQN